MAGGGFGSILGLGASLIAPEIAPEVFGSGASLGTRLLSNAALGGGIAALTGGNPFLGALAGGAGAGIKGLMSGPTAQFSPEGTSAAPGANVANATDLSGTAVANSPWTSGAVSATSPFGTVGTADMANMTASQLASAGSNITPQVLSQLGQQATPAATPQGIAGDTSTYTSTEPRPNFGQTAPPNVEAASIDAQSKSILPTSTANVDTTSPSAQTRLADLKQGMSQNWSDLKNWWGNLDKTDKMLIAGAGGITALYALQPKYKMPVMQQTTGPKFGLASNYQATPNPIPVYPRFAEGGVAQLASGGMNAPAPAHVDFMGGDMFPMSQQQRSFYASPTQMPTSAQQALASYEPNTNPLTGIPTAHMADGGIADLGSYSDGGRMLKGPGDGMSDSIPGIIADKRPARLADGEFVVPADVVSHLGNGSTDAGAKHLYKMLDRVRQARTGRKSQGTQINPARLMPA